MYDTFIGRFKSKSDYREAGIKTLVKLYISSGFSEDNSKFQIIKQEFEVTFGRTTFEKNNEEMVTVRMGRSGHNEVWERKEVGL